MRSFNELNEAYERIMLAEPKKEKLVKKPKDADLFGWDQFVEWIEMEELDFQVFLWDCWKEGYTAGLESGEKE